MVLRAGLISKRRSFWQSRSRNSHFVRDHHIVVLRVSCSTNTMAEETTARSLSNCKKRRGIARASITWFSTKLQDLERKADQAGTFDLAQQMKLKLESLDKDFKTYHYALVDLIDDEATLASEQETLDSHDNEMAIQAVSVQELITLLPCQAILILVRSHLADLLDYRN